MAHRTFAATVLAGLVSICPAAASEIVVTHWSALLYGAPYAVAQEKGYFQEEGVKLDGILSSKGGGTSVRNLMAGETLFAEVALPAALAAIKEGFPIKIISGGTEGSASFWVSRENDKFEKPADLKGKRFAFSRPKSVSESGVLAALKSHNIPPDQVKMVAAGDIGAGITALEHNQVDVATLPEPIYSTKTKQGMRYHKMNWFSEKVPPSTQTVGVATLENIQKRDAELRAVIRARQRGVDFIYANPEEASKLIAKAYNMSPELMLSAMKGTMELAPKWWSRGELNYSNMNNAAEGLASVDLLKLPVDWKAVATESLLPADLRKEAGR
ncbi:ABC transporter substrate-binding protein [Bradyrhizobium sp. LHD-71]|uniref:ABC transporter substrate-binding protein n=1 Tax=Bradyrhizobium sp. LHD-71 TaxID=3072141 RepID=UPI00280DA06D|nr:ABC transporter substrate-binding protein [Bradyrhizobium sp. LHD-71]MDQ8728482.1 ABC transporter substrate-binding protein [Bradyrhizobium sp. LHD-71]